VWWWVGLFAALAVAGLGVLVGYAVWLTHKAADVLSEVGSLAGLGAQMLDLLEQLRLPDREVPSRRDDRAAIAYAGVDDVEDIG